MKENEEHIDLIEGFLQNTLTEDELEEFEELLIKDDQFGQMFIDMKTMIDGIRTSASKTTVEEKLKRLGITEMKESNPGREESTDKGNRNVILVAFNYLERQKWAVAAVITFFMVATAVVININTKPSGGKLFDEYFTPFNSGGAYGYVRGDSVKNDLQHQAFNYYDQEEYTLADDYFDRILDKDSKNIMALFYSGNALMAIGQINEAIERFREVISLHQGLEVQAKWYMALCYLKIEDYTNMIPLLKDIVKTNTRYSDMAVELLSKFNK